jgi:TIR domain
VNEETWDDLLGHIRQRVLVPVVGPDVTVVNVGHNQQTLSALIGQRLAEKYELTVSPGMVTMSEAVAGFLRERGRDEVERLYRVINDIIVELDPAPGDALRDLAAITDLRLFVTTTPDRLLAQAMNNVRFQGRRATRELTFSPSQSTSVQSRDSQPAAPTDTVILSLFGQAASLPQYAIHDEDRLEWLHALLSDAASLPDWVAYKLKQQPILFVGCEIPDWIGRFLLRMSSDMRLSLERKQFFFVGSLTSQEPSLSNFFATYCRKAQVQQLDMAPTDFVAELRKRWEARRPEGDGPPPPDGTIFISYMREDADAAGQLADAITRLGGDVWLDTRRIRPGDTWKRETEAAIRKTIRLFIAVISANTEREEEGYVFKEWNLAVERSLSIPRRRFIVPVIVDEKYEPSRYQQIPDDFGPLDFGHAPAGKPDEDLLAMLTDEIRAMRRSDAA